MAAFLKEEPEHVRKARRVLLVHEKSCLVCKHSRVGKGGLQICRAGLEVFKDSGCSAWFEDNPETQCLFCKNFLMEGPLTLCRIKSREVYFDSGCEDFSRRAKFNEVYTF